MAPQNAVDILLVCGHTKNEEKFPKHALALTHLRCRTRHLKTPLFDILLICGHTKNEKFPKGTFSLLFVDQVHSIRSLVLSDGNTVQGLQKRYTNAQFRLQNTIQCLQNVMHTLGFAVVPPVLSNDEKSTSQCSSTLQGNYCAFYRGITLSLKGFILIPSEFFAYIGLLSLCFGRLN